MFLINDELIWISIPRCASVSIEKAIYQSSLNIRNIKSDKYPIQKSNGGKHYHAKKIDCIDYFGYKETVCITRNWLDRLLSAFEYFFIVSKIVHKNELICEWENVDNNFIYEYFNKDFANAIYSEKNEDIQKHYNKFFTKINKNWFGTLYIFNSQNFWKENEKCTYEFDITELDKFKTFIYEKYGVELNIIKTNDNRKEKSKIEVNDELKNFLWNTFESRFVKNGNLV
jgi:hypothetical protein